MNRYIDIDSVLIDTKEYKQMIPLKEFLTTVFDISNNNVYWLSTHTKNGESDFKILLSMNRNKISV